MEFAKNKKTKTLIATIILAVLILPMAIQPQTAVAETDIPVYLKVYAAPNPVGVGQVVYISLFFTKPIPTGLSAWGGDVYTGLTLNIVAPDGTNTTLGPYTSDTTGGVGGIEYTPTTTGNYTVQAFYAGQVLADTYNILATQSEPAYFTVQEEPITGISLTPLPTEYWSRPIYATNYLWSQIGGNWWGLGKPSFTDTGGYDASNNNFNPYTTAPNSAHIMWVKAAAFGGQVGGPISGDQESQYTSTSILYRQFEPVILNGIIYYKVYTNTPTTETSAETPGWNAVDLRTGELLWHKDTSDTLDFGFVMQFHTIQEYGTQAFLVGSLNSPSLFSTGTGKYVWQLFDPSTGYFIANITDVPATAAAGLVEADDDNTQGAVYIYSITNGNLTMWNSTKCLCSASGSVVIRPSGNINYTAGYEWSVEVPTTLNSGTISPALSIAAQTNDVILLRSYPETLDTFAAEFGGAYEVECSIDAKTGELMWGPVNRTVTEYHEIGVIAAGDDYYVEHDKDTNTAYVYSLETGKQIGSAIQLKGSSLSTLSRGGAIAYGKCYIWDFGGYVNAIDLETAKVVWTYVPESAGYDTPYGIYPIWHFGTHSIADGKLFLSQGRMYDPPLFAGAKKLALNCTNGELVWSVLGTYAREPSAIADGYMVGYNSYDAQIYCFGKGPTQTTVSAPDVGVSLGQSVVISGTVLDVSTGTTDSDRSARFPNGVACVSDESQSDWMEYVYMQQEKPTNATGVTVQLYVLDANGNSRSIGTTTTDLNGYYSYNWVPDIPGAYTVYAVFEGSESYYGSQATASFAVDEPAATATPVPVVTLPPTETYFAISTIAIILSIAVVGLLILKKKP
ncbi:MAG: hypothetical protein NWE95_03320 [Candidatus Bathyarchaeota archaeon]|nr:hypothetical protein [Candidatus Bathyarchaeota archaeon]